MKDNFEIWTTKKGTGVKVSEMATSHLINSIKKIESSNGGWRSEWLPYLKKELEKRNLISSHEKSISSLIPSVKEQKYFLNTSCDYQFIEYSDIVNKINKENNSYSVMMNDYINNLCLAVESKNRTKVMSELTGDITKLSDLQVFKKYESMKLENVFSKEWSSFINLMLGRR